MQGNTPKTELAQSNAKLSFVGIKGIKPCGNEPVYNMEVDQFHNFSVNSGIIVHNCMDDIRYFCMTALRNLTGKEKYTPIWDR